MKPGENGVCIMSDDQMTIKDVARLMEVDEKTVQRWIKNGELHAIKDIFGRYQISRSDLDAFREQRHRRYNPDED
jgi:excisionase family DNA binding protein